MKLSKRLTISGGRLESRSSFSQLLPPGVMTDPLYREIKIAGCRFEKHPNLLKIFYDRWQDLSLADRKKLDLLTVKALIKEIGIEADLQDVLELGDDDFAEWVGERFPELEHSNGSNIGLFSEKGVNAKFEALDFTKSLDFTEGLSLLLRTYKICVHERPKKATNSSLGMRSLLIDPENSVKKTWDVLCMALLAYCSFSVPYGIAFEGGSQSGLNSLELKLELAIDIVFLIDIALSFITRVEIHGNLTKSHRKIALRYASTWLVPDFLGSFPFDIVASAIMGSGSNLSTMRFVRMIRLIRAVRLLAKLNGLRNREGYERLGTIISIGTSLFALSFTSHLMGCMFTIIANDEGDNNWLAHYASGIGQELDDDWSRYVVAAYWAIISLTTMGYGDIVPITQAGRTLCSKMRVHIWLHTLTSFE